MKQSLPLFPRRKTRPVKIGQVVIGGGAPIIVQSMTKTDTRDVQSTVSQIKSLEKAGCEVVRLAVPDGEAAKALGEIKRKVSLPLVADIHFDYRLAVASLQNGADALRINPGNIGSRERVREVVKAARDFGVPIRIGVNAGSLEKDLRNIHGIPTPQAMVESALRHVDILEGMDFYDIKISLKASSVLRTIRACELLADKVDYPFHAGITESGSLVPGSIKSSAGLALLLSLGLADTIRVSLTAPPEDEVRVGFRILQSLGLRDYGPDIVSCPTCGRCEVDLFKIVEKVERELASVRTNIHVAVMGCMVNGPGEAREADIGVACGRGVGVLFKKGKVYRKLKEKSIIPELVREVKEFEKLKNTGTNRKVKT